MTVRSDLDRLPALADSIATLTRKALDAMREEIDAAGDGYPATASGAYRTSGGGPTWRVDADEHGPEERIPVTSVEATVGRTGRLLAVHAKIRTDLANLVQTATALDVLIRRQIPLPDVKRCDRGVGREGHVVWQDPLCVNWADPACAPMCAECWAREAAWRKPRGLPERERIVPDEPRPLCIRCGTREATPGRSDRLCNADRIKDSRARTG